MKYFIGYLIEGEAAAWHLNVARNISDKFATWKIHERIPPHITLYDPFETENIRPVKTYLNDLTKGTSVPGNFAFTGFDHFDDRVVFVNAKAGQVTTRTAMELREGLGGIIVASSEKGILPWLPHATLANKLAPQEINRIWDYVRAIELIPFVLPFNNVTIFRKEGEQKWVVEKSYTFKKNSSLTK